MLSREIFQALQNFTSTLPLIERQVYRQQAEKFGKVLKAILNEIPKVKE